MNISGITVYIPVGLNSAISLQLPEGVKAQDVIDRLDQIQAVVADCDHDRIECIMVNSQYSHLITVHNLNDMENDTKQ